MPSRTYFSHPPMRPPHKPVDRPMNQGAARFVDAQRGADSGAGDDKSPWKTIAHALRQLRAGDTLYLRGGTYYESLYIAVAGTEDQPTTIRSYPNEIAIIDASLREFFDSPREAWVPIDGPVPNYFRSALPYRNQRYAMARFGDSMVGLLTYQHREDIEETRRVLYAKEDDEPYPVPVYLGPGLWHDPQSGYIYCRLSHTDYKFETPGAADYKGVRDPREIPLVLSFYGCLPLFIDGAQNLILQDLVFRGAGEDCVKLRGAHNLTFDNVTIYCGTYGLHARSSGCVKFLNSAMYGNLPPWHVHCGQSLRVYDMHTRMPNGKPPTRDVARLNTHVIMAIEGRTEEQVDYCVPANHNWELAYSDFTDSLDGIHLGGFNIRFHHNRVDRCMDDSIYLTPLTPRAMDNVHVYCNLFTRVMLAFGFGGESEPGGAVYIYRNVVDQRHEFLWTHYRKALNHSFVGHFRKPFEFGQIYIYQNTFIAHMNVRLSETTTQDINRCYGQSTLAFTQPGVPRRVFNNVFVHLRGMVPPREETLPQLHEDVQIDGNVHYDLVNPQKAASKLDAFRKSELFEKTRSLYAPGWEASSRVDDPKFAAFSADQWQRNDYRITPGSAAAGAGVPLPESFTDPLGPTDGRRPDAGAIPLNHEFRAGRELDDEAIEIYQWLER